MPTGQNSQKRYVDMFGWVDGLHEDDEGVRLGLAIVR